MNLAVRDGECILLCGRSGCGKTTITRLVNGLIPRFYSGDLSGKVLINGQDMADLSMYELAEHIGSVFQNPRTQFFTDSLIEWELILNRPERTPAGLNTLSVRKVFRNLKKRKVGDGNMVNILDTPSREGDEILNET